MKVKELQALLYECDPESEVILQKDPEGNGYSPLYGVDNETIYDSENSHAHSTNWSAEDACMSDSAWAEALSQPRCVVLWPTN